MLIFEVYALIHVY